eukprot:1158529-Pelagomonas_calceolata.AAC.10
MEDKACTNLPLANHCTLLASATLIFLPHYTSNPDVAAFIALQPRPSRTPHHTHATPTITHPAHLCQVLTYALVHTCAKCSSTHLPNAHLHNILHTCAKYPKVVVTSRLQNITGLQPLITCTPVPSAPKLPQALCSSRVLLPSGWARHPRQPCLLSDPSWPAASPGLVHVGSGTPHPSPGPHVHAHAYLFDKGTNYVCKFNSDAKKDKGCLAEDDGPAYYLIHGYEEIRPLLLH